MNRNLCFYVDGDDFLPFFNIEAFVVNGKIQSAQIFRWISSFYIREMIFVEFKGTQ